MPSICRRTYLLALLGLLSTASHLPLLALDKPGPIAVKIAVDTSEVPELKKWGEDAARLVAKWYPIVTRLMHSEGFTPPGEVKIIFKRDMKGVAGTSGHTIYIAANWVKQHPGDYGMVIHEMTHVVQSYPKYDPPWLVEGIADYIRFSHFEPKVPLPPINRDRASYRDGYQTTCRFLAWLEKKYDKNIVFKLNSALRKSRYSELLFKQITGMTLDELWKEFLANLSARQDNQERPWQWFREAGEFCLVHESA